jgi:hypothetical protein
LLAGLVFLLQEICTLDGKSRLESEFVFSAYGDLSVIDRTFCQLKWLDDPQSTSRSYYVELTMLAFSVGLNIS